MKITSKRIIIVISIFMCLAALTYLAIYLRDVSDYKQAVKETVFKDIDISRVPDGTYVGEYDVDFIYAKVKVTVQNRVVTEIDLLEHRNERGKSAEIVTERIIEEQRTDVDAISGATNSSIVIKKAVEIALDGEG